MIKTILNRRDKRVYDFILSDEHHLGTVPNRQYVDLLYSMGKMFFWEKDDKVIGAGGVYKVWLGCGYAWAYFSPEIKACPLRLHKDCKKYMLEFSKEMGLHRIHTLMDPFNPVSLKWVDVLGFSQEGYFKEYTTNRTDVAQYWRKIEWGQ